MTDRLKGAVVTFSHDIREDDAEALLQAIGMIRGVASVTPSVAYLGDHMARERVRSELRVRLYDAIRVALDGGTTS